MSVSVCLSVYEHIDETTFESPPMFRACYLWLGRPLAACDVLCTSGYANDVVLAHNGQE